MESTEVLILFIAVVMVAALTIGAIMGQFTAATNRAQSTGRDVRKALSDFAIVYVNENNIFVKGIAGSLDVRRTATVLNGSPVDVNVYILSDSRISGLLDPGDTALIRMSVPYKRGDCLIVTIGPATSTYGPC